MTTMAHEMQMVVLELIDEVSVYSNFVVGKIAEESHDFASNLKSGMEKRTRKAREFYFEQNITYYQLVSETFNEIALNSTIVMLYSTVERGLFLMANGYTLDKTTDIAFDPPKRGRVLEEVKIYFRDNLRIDFGCNIYWPKIKALGKIRNAIVHDGSEIEEKKALKDTFIKQQINSGNLKLHTQGLDSGLIVVTGFFIRDILQPIRKFFAEMPI